MIRLRVVLFYGGVMNKFEKCLNDRKIIRIKTNKEMIDREIQDAKYDLNKAEESLNRDDAKWASIQAYYSMFHSAKALILRKGYRERSHYCLMVALEELYGKTGELDKEHIENFEICMDIRHEADYGMTYDVESATMCIEASYKLLEKSKKILGK